jgi:hypothetical protein
MEPAELQGAGEGIVTERHMTARTETERHMTVRAVELTTITVVMTALSHGGCEVVGEL